MTDFGWTATRGFVVPLLIFAMAAPLLAGCGVVRQLKPVGQSLARSNIESTLPEIGAAIQGLKPQTWAETKAKAAWELTQKGLDFACNFPVDKGADAAKQAVDAELYRRKQAAAAAGLEEIAGEYEYALAPDESLNAAQAAVFGLYALATYCNVEQSGL